MSVELAFLRWTRAAVSSIGFGFAIRQLLRSLERGAVVIVTGVVAFGWIIFSGSGEDGAMGRCLDG